VINISNFKSEDNPPWPQGGASGRLTSVGPSVAARATGRSAGARTGGAGARSRDTWARMRDTWTRIGNAVTVIAWVLAGWVSSMPSRWLDRLFEMNDAEAYWRGWQITKVHGGLGRRYRDPRFDTLAECSGCGGTGSWANQPCSPCLGTGRVEVEGTGRVGVEGTGRVGVEGTGGARPEAGWATGEVS
jgi:hypothetical protein